VHRQVCKRRFEQHFEVVSPLLYHHILAYQHVAVGPFEVTVETELLPDSPVTP
jgi:hypothetical protein